MRWTLAIIFVILLLQGQPGITNSDQSYGTLVGKVYFAEGSTPASYVEIMAKRRITNGFDDIEYKIITDSKGIFSMKLPEGYYRVTARKDDPKTPGKDYLSSSEIARIDGGKETILDFTNSNGLGLVNSLTIVFIVNGIDRKRAPWIKAYLSQTDNKYELESHYFDNGYAFFRVNVPLATGIERASFIIENFNQDGTGTLMYHLPDTGYFQGQGKEMIVDTTGRYLTDLGYMRIKVVDSENIPLGGARVSLNYFEGDTFDHFTDSNGIANILVDPHLTYTVNVSCDYLETTAPDYLPYVFDNNGKGISVTDFEEVTIMLSKPVLYSFKVEDQNKNRVPFMQIYTYYKDLSGFKLALPFITDENGDADVWLDPKKRYAFSLRGSYIHEEGEEKIPYMPEFFDNGGLGFEPKNTTLAVSKANKYIFTVYSNRIPKGSKSNVSIEPQPLEEAVVLPCYKEGELWKKTKEYKTDFQGKATLWLAPNKKYAFSVSYDVFGISSFTETSEEVQYMPLFLDNEGLGFDPKDFSIQLNEAQKFLIGIKDEANNALQGALVTPYYKDGEKWRKTKTYMSDEEGLAAVWLDPSRTYAYGIECDNPQTPQKDFFPLFDNNEGKGYPADYRLFILKSAAYFVLEIYDENNVPVDRAKIEPFYFEENIKREVGIFFTNAKGEASLFLDPKRRYAFKITCDLPETARIDYSPSYFDNDGFLYSPSRLKFILETTYKFNVIVMDNEGTPISAMHITKYHWENDKWVEGESYISDKNGNTEMWGVLSKKYAFELFYDYIPGRMDFMPLWTDNNGEGFAFGRIEIRLNRTKSFKITVVDAEGNPIQRAKVVPYYRYGDEWIETRVFLTDSRGEAEVWIDPKYKYAFFIECDYPETEEIEYMPTFFAGDRGYAPQGMTFSLTKAKKYVISVSDKDWNPINNASIMPRYLEGIRWRETKAFFTDRNGKAEAYLDPTKIYSYYINADDPNTEKLDYVPQLLDNEGKGIPPKDMNLVMVETIPLEINVKDSDDNPIERIRIIPSYLERKDWKKKWVELRHSFTNEEGICILWIDPYKRYSFEILPEKDIDGKTEYMPMVLDNNGEGFVAQTLNIILHETKPFEIMVVDDNGRPIVGAKVTPYFLDEKEKEKWNITDYFLTDYNGKATIWTDPTKRYAFYVEHDVLETERIEHMPLWMDNEGRGYEPSEITAKMSETSLMLIKVKDNDGSPIHGATVTPYYLGENLWRRTMPFVTDNKGEAEVWMDPKRRYAFSVECDYVETEGLDFIPLWQDNDKIGYEFQDLEFTMVETNSVRVKVIDENGRLLKATVDLYYLELDAWVLSESFYVEGEGEIWYDPTRRISLYVFSDDPDTSQPEYVPQWRDLRGAKEIEITLAKTERFQIRIVDEDGNPVSRAKVYPSRYEDLKAIIYFESDDYGIVELWLDPKDKYSFSIVCDRLETEGIDYVPLWEDNKGKEYEVGELTEAEFQLLKGGTIEFPLFTDMEINDIRKIVEVRYFNEPKLLHEEIKPFYDLKKTPTGYLVRITLPVSKYGYELRMEEFYDQKKLNNASQGYFMEQGAEIHLITKQEEIEIMIGIAEELIEEGKYARAQTYLIEARGTAEDRYTLEKINLLAEKLAQRKDFKKEIVKKYWLSTIYILIFLQIAIIVGNSILKRR